MKIMELESTTKAVHSSTSPNDCRKYAQLQAVSGNTLFEEFLSECTRAVEPADEISRGIEKIRKRFDEVDVVYKDSQSFISFLQNIIPRVAAEPWQCMKSVADTLKRHPARKTITRATNSTADAHCSQSSIIDKKTQRLIGKLESTLSKLARKIHALEESEINFQDSDEENSSYVQVSRYKKRYCAVHNKVRELKKIAESDGPSKVIRFSGTRIPSVNRAIERFYNDKKEFPDFPDILNVVRLVNDRKNLGLSQAEVQETAKIAFEELGQTLKLQRQYEFHDIMSTYLPMERDDPALVDSELERKLAENQRLYGHKVDEIINKFAIQQEKDRLQAVEVSSDAESLVSDSEEEDDVESVTSISERETESPSDEETPARTFSIVLEDVKKLPVWAEYQARITRPTLRELAHSREMNEPCCSKSLFSPSTDRRKRKKSDSEDSADASEANKAKFIPSVLSSFSLSKDENEETIARSVKEVEERTRPARDLKQLVQFEPSEQINHGVDQSSREDALSRVICQDSNSGDECVVVDSEIQPATRAQDDSVASSKDTSAISAPPPSVQDVTISEDSADTAEAKKAEFIPSVNHVSLSEGEEDEEKVVQSVEEVEAALPAEDADNVDVERRDGTAVTDNDRLDKHVLIEIDNEQSNSLLLDELKSRGAESLGSLPEKTKRCEPDVIAKSVSSQNSRLSPSSAESIPSCPSSTEKVKDNDDDIMIVDEISPRKKRAETVDRNEIIDVDKLERRIQPRPGKRALAVDLNTLVRNVKFMPPNPNNGPSTSRRQNNFNVRHQIPNLGYRGRMAQPARSNANRPLRMSGRSFHQVNQRLHFNQTLCKRTTQTNEIRYVQNNYHIAKRTTMVEESVLQTSIPRFSVVANGDFSAPLRDSNCPNSSLRSCRRARRMTPCSTQRTSVPSDSTDEVVTLD